MVVEVLEYDQYRVKVAGTGRITLRNRRFLRKYQPHLLHGTTKDPIYCGIPPPIDTTPGVTFRSSDAAYLQPPPPVNAAHPTTQSTEDVQPQKLDAFGAPDEGRTLLATPGELDITPSPVARCSPSSSTVTDDEKQQPRRSTRLRFAKKQYEPETGKYILPNE